MQRYIRELGEREPALKPIINSIETAFVLWVESYRQGGKLLLCGNGGSAADCEHIAGELMKGFLHKRPIPEKDQEILHKMDVVRGVKLGQMLQGALPAIPLTSSVALNTAVINDNDPNLI